MRFPTVLLSGYLSFATCGTELNNYFVAASSFFIISTGCNRAYKIDFLTFLKPITHAAILFIDASKKSVAVR